MWEDSPNTQAPIIRQGIKIKSGTSRSPTKVQSFGPSSGAFHKQGAKIDVEQPGHELGFIRDDSSYR